MIRYWTEYNYHSHQLNLLDLPDYFSELVGANFRRTFNDLIRQHLKMKRQAAEKQLTNLRSRLIRDNSGNLVLSFPTALDYDIINCVLGHLTTRPAFTDQDLIDQLIECLLAFRARPFPALRDHLRARQPPPTRTRGRRPYLHLARVV
jgi:hypothetical protein